MEQRFYFNERIDKAINKVMDYPLTIVSAPLAFGKHTAVEEAVKRVKEQGVNVKWIVLQKEDRKNYLQYIKDRLSEPKEGKMLYILDGCQTDGILKQRWKYELSYETWNKDMHFICIMNKNIPMNGIHLNHTIHSITKEDLELKEKDILKLYQLNGIKITYQTARILYEYSSGWAGAIMLGIREYHYNRKIMPGIGVGELLERDFINHLTMEEKEVLFSLYQLKEVTLDQIGMLIGDKNDDTCQYISTVIDKNPFIEYDMIHDTYQIQMVLYHYLKQGVKKLPRAIQKRIYTRRAKWFESQKDYKSSIDIYSRLEEYELIFSYPYQLSELNQCLDYRFLEKLWEIMEHSPDYLKCKYPRFPLLVAGIFLLWGQERRGNRILDEIEENLNEVLQLPKRMEEQLRGEIYFLRSLSFGYHLNQVEQYYKKSYELLKGNSTIYDNGIVFTHGIPSICHLYYSIPGQLNKTIQKLKSCMTNYYRLTNGNGMGNWVAMQAEVNLLKCQIEEAESLAYEAIKISEKGGQLSVKIAGQFLRMRICLYLEQHTKAEKYLEAIRQEAKESKDRELLLEAELCTAYFYLFLGELDKIPEWLKEDHSADKQYSEAFINYIHVYYLKFLLAKGQEQELISIGNYIHNQVRRGGFLYAEIEIEIIRSVAYHRLGNRKKSIEYMKKVLDLAQPDGLYYPIILYYAELVHVFEVLLHEEKYHESVKQILELYKNVRSLRRYNQQKEKKERNPFGLTDRELEIAILGAKRFRNSEIAKRLYISENTVKYNMKHIFQKLSIKSRLELREYFKDS